MKRHIISWSCFQTSLCTTGIPVTVGTSMPSLTPKMLIAEDIYLGVSQKKTNWCLWKKVSKSPALWITSSREHPSVSLLLQSITHPQWAGLVPVVVARPEAPRRSYFRSEYVKSEGCVTAGQNNALRHDAKDGSWEQARHPCSVAKAGAICFSHFIWENYWVVCAWPSPGRKGLASCGKKQPVVT